MGHVCRRGPIGQPRPRPDACDVQTRHRSKTAEISESRVEHAVCGLELDDLAAYRRGPADRLDVGGRPSRVARDSTALRVDVGERERGWSLFDQAVPGSAEPVVARREDRRALAPAATAHVDGRREGLEVIYIQRSGIVGATRDACPKLCAGIVGRRVAAKHERREFIAGPGRGQRREPCVAFGFHARAGSAGQRRQKTSDRKMTHRGMYD